VGKFEGGQARAVAERQPVQVDDDADDRLRPQLVEDGGKPFGWRRPSFD
jgi:hypothetical protein